VKAASKEIAMSGELQRVGGIETILRPGQIVGEKYHIEKLLAEGGMAAVWAGVNERTGKRVALKVILPSFAGIGEAAELFRREALAASKVNHPNVVSIFDVIDHVGMTCIVMELLEGETLASYLTKKGPLSLDEAAALLLPAMRGVAAANALGVVHRDLKPGNIFLCSDSDGRLLASKVLDFGISTMMSRTGETSTEAEVLPMFGTPAYMSPEAIECSPAVDARADVYGFGVLLFEMLTGQVPFPGEPAPELLVRILNDPPPKVTDYKPELPAAIASVIDHALAKKAEDRFPDVEHLIRALEDQVLAQLSVSRSLSPIAGVSLLLLSDSKSDAAVPKVHATNENSGRVRIGETMALYSMAGESVHPTDRSGATQTQILSPTVLADLTRRARAILPIFGHVLHRRAGIVASVTIFLMMTTWLTIAGSARRRAAGKEHSARPVPAQGPLVTPLRSSSPVPAPSPAVDNLAGSLAASESIGLDSQGPQAPMAAARPGLGLGATSGAVRAATTVPSRRVAQAQAVRGRPRHAASNRLFVPRAGKLSAKDF
jgi:serine/threonine protein kinase